MIEMQLELMDLDRFDIYWIHNVWDAPHWTEELAEKHGAAPDSWFSHLALEVPGADARAEWLEPVSDEQYNKLK